MSLTIPATVAIFVSEGVYGSVFVLVNLYELCRIVECVCAGREGKENRSVGQVMSLVL
jgi:hypothetical protein